jgi:hypothetical protein
MARLNVSLTNEMAKKIQDSAESDGKTISSLITESVDLYLHLKEMGLSRSSLMRLLSYFEVIKSMNAVPIPNILLDSTLNLALQSSKDKILELWCESAKMTGEFIKGVEPDIRKLPEEIKEYSNFTPLGKMELRNEGENVEFLLMGTGYSIGAARVTAEAMKCFLSVYGVRDMQDTVSEGFAKVTGKIKPSP